MATVAAKEVVLRVIEMLSGARSREEASDYIDPLVTIHVDSATHRGIEMWHKWVYLLRNSGHLRDLRFLPCELYLDAEDPSVVNVIGSWVGFGRFDGLPRTAPNPSYFRYRLESNHIVELWTRRSNYDFVLGRWLRFSALYRLFLGWAALHFRWTSRKGLNYRIDRAA
jgi:hypothetical protein